MRTTIMKKSCMLLATLLCMSLQAQDVDQQVIATEGGYATTASGSVSWTTGQAISGTLQNTNYVTQGFQQADKEIAKVFLFGPFDNSTALMNDDLRVAGYIPNMSPYADAVTAGATAFNATGNNAVVDWIWVELRSSTDNTNVIEGRSALLQRDGDIVGLDGVNKIAFTNKGMYYVAIQHRNHLGAMTATPRRVYPNSFVLNFTDTSLTYYGTSDARAGIPEAAPVHYVLFGGDVNDDQIVQFSGTNPNNDSNALKSVILNDPSNFLGLLTFTLSGYNQGDLNMDGFTKFSGSNSDSNTIKSSVLLAPGNILNFLTYVINEQLP